MGIGLVGDQELDQALIHGRNRTLAELPVNEVSAFLFERYEKGSYTYVGQVELAGPPLPEHQRDLTGRLRKVWVFPLRLKGGQAPPPVTTGILDGKRKAQEKAAARLPIETLIGKAQEVGRKPGTHTLSVQVVDRNPYVAEYKAEGGDGRCGLC